MTDNIVIRYTETWLVDYTSQSIVLECLIYKQCITHLKVGCTIIFMCLIIMQAY
jgi:hypothetical protein